jgi:phosphoglycolate phosphatase-like HAD superfamily hydrolase
MTGRTEHAIIIETLTLNDTEISPSLISKFYFALGEAAQELEGSVRESGHPLPGARNAISAFQGRHVMQSVATGNIRSIAKTKLNAFDLTEGLDLEVGGYGDDGSDRADLVRLAIERTEAKYRIDIEAKRTFVIGDTPHDIKGARDVGAFAVGVATGSSPIEVLQQSGADLVLTDLTNTTELRTLIFNSRRTQ